MSEKKMNYNSRQNLTFQAETPDFLKMLQGANNTSNRDKRIPDFSAENDEDSGPEAPEKDDEKPQIVVEKGITDMEVRDFLGDDAKEKDQGGKRAAADDEEESERELEEPSTADGKITFRKPKKKAGGSATAEKRRKIDEKKKAVLANSKKVKNKGLLSFDDEEG